MCFPSRNTLESWSVCLVFALLAGCRSTPAPEPVILYPGEPRPASEVCVIQIVKTGAGAGHASIDVREIMRVGLEPEIFYSVRPGTTWTPPEHFMGPPPKQRSGPARDPRILPVHFELVPGSYQVNFFYVPAPDRFGWIHRPRMENTTRVNCRGGHTYFLEGQLREDGTGWVLAIAEEETGG